MHRCILPLSTLMCLAIGGSAVGFDQIVTLGDSLLDDVDGLRSPVAAEQLAQRLGVSLTKYAVFGATSDDLISGGQHTLAADNFGPGDLAILWIGGNDFFGNAVGTALGGAGFLDALEANVDAAIGTLRDAGLDVVALNLPDFAKVPAIQETIKAVVPFDVLKQSALDNFTNATQEWNARLSAIAFEHGAAVVDVYSVVNQLWLEPDRFAILGHQPVLSHDWGCQFCVFADIAHPSSYAQAYIANEAMSAVDEFFDRPGGAALTPLSGVEIALLADLLAGDFDEDGVVDVDDLSEWTQGFLSPSDGGSVHADGDADGDQLVAGSDFLWWQRQYDARLSSSAALAVPEPGAMALLAWMTLSIVWVNYGRVLHWQRRLPITE